jgi:hypothetical protein
VRGRRKGAAAVKKVSGKEREAKDRIENEDEKEMMVKAGRQLEGIRRKRPTDGQGLVQGPGRLKEMTMPGIN